MTTFTTTYYAYDKSHRMTTQYVLGGEAHYFTYNERDMIASIQDLNGAGDANRYFTYNGVGERVLMRDSASNLSYLTYDGSKLLTEKTETGKVYGRYRHNMSVQDRVRGSGLEFTISDGTVTYFSNPAYDHTGNTRYAYSNEAGNVSYVYNAVGQQLLTPGGAVTGKALATSRLQGLTGLGFQQLTTTELFAVTSSLLFLQTQAAFASLTLTSLRAVVPPIALAQNLTLGIRGGVAFGLLDWLLPQASAQDSSPIPTVAPPTSSAFAFDKGASVGAASRTGSCYPSYILALTTGTSLHPRGPAEMGPLGFKKSDRLSFTHFEVAVLLDPARTTNWLACDYQQWVKGWLTHPAWGIVYAGTPSSEIDEKHTIAKSSQWHPDGTSGFINPEGWQADPGSFLTTPGWAGSLALVAPFTVVWDDKPTSFGPAILDFKFVAVSSDGGSSIYTYLSLGSEDFLEDREPYYK